MALYKVMLRKATPTYGGRKWSNTYYVEAANPTEAFQSGQEIWVGGERLFHHTDVFLYEIYVNNTADAPYTPGTTFTPNTANPAGARSYTTNALPEWNAVRVDFAVVGSRPSRKFYHLNLREEDVNSNLIDLGSMVAAIQQGANFIAGLNYMRDPDGQPYAGTASAPVLTSRRLGKFAAVNVPAPPA